MLGVAIALPFARRDDLLGWLSIFVMLAFAVGLWAFLVFASIRTLLAWCRDKPIEPADPRIGECYADHVYKLCWDHDSFALQTHSGKALVQVPLADIVDVLDMDALLLEEDITVSTPTRHVEFPRSRSERYKIFQLLGDLVGSSAEAQEKLELQRVRLRRRFAAWFPVSLLTVAVLLIPIFTVPGPKQPNLLWGIVGIVYGLAWWWAFWRFAYSIACFFASRRLRGMLMSANKFQET